MIGARLVVQQVAQATGLSCAFCKFESAGGGQQPYRVACKLVSTGQYLTYLTNIHLPQPPEVLEHKPDERQAGGSGSHKKDDQLWIASIKDWMRNHEQQQVRLLTESLRTLETRDVALTTESSPVSPPTSESQLSKSSSVVIPLDSVASSLDGPSPPPERPTLPWLQSYSSSGKSPSPADSNSPLFPVANDNVNRSEPHLGSTKQRRANTTTVSVSSDTEEAGETAQDAEPLDTNEWAAEREPDQAKLGRNVSSSSTIKDAKQQHARGASFQSSHRSSLTNLSPTKSLPDLRLTHAQILAQRRGSNEVGPDDPAEVASMHDGMASTKDQTEPTHQVVESSKPLHKNPNLPFGEHQEPSVEVSGNAYFTRHAAIPSSIMSKTLPASLHTCADKIRGLLYAMCQIHSGLKQYLDFATDDRIVSVFSRVLDPAAGYLHQLIGALDTFDAHARRGVVPPPSAVRLVLETCRDSVAVLAKVVSVLKLQVAVLKTMADARYTKTVLLLIYGAFAEIVEAWQGMAPVLQNIQPLLVGSTSNTQTQATTPSTSGNRHRRGPSHAGSLRTPISPIPERGESHSPSSVLRSSTKQAAGSPARGPVDPTPKASPTSSSNKNREKSRRHAGSFSAEDVQTGMMLGPVDGLSTSTSAATSASPDSIHSASGLPPVSSSSIISRKSSSHLRQSSTASQVILEADEEGQDDDEDDDPTAEVTAHPDNLVMMPPVSSVQTSSREGSFGAHRYLRDHQQQQPQQHHGPSSSTSSLKSFNALRSHLRREGYLDATSSPPAPTSHSSNPPKSAATVVDEGVLDTLEQALDIAYTVWLRLAEDLQDPAREPGKLGLTKLDTGSSGSGGGGATSVGSPNVKELLDRIVKAEGTTRHLHESLMELRAQANPEYTTLGPTAGEAEQRLPHDAQSFIKAVVRVSELVILVSQERVFPVSVRTLLAKLTSKTRECGILLQVSTLKPITLANGQAGGMVQPGGQVALNGSQNTAVTRPFSPAFGL